MEDSQAINRQRCPLPLRRSWQVGVTESWCRSFHPPRAAWDSFVAGPRSRVLLIENLDRGEEDLPYDLLDALEERAFEIPELARLPLRRVEVRTYDDGREIIEQGHVRCTAIPVVIITSGEERVLPAPFLQQCIQLRLQPPAANEIARIVVAHLGPEALEDARPLIDDFLHRRQYGELAVEQLLDAIFLSQTNGVSRGEGREQLARGASPLFRGSVRQRLDTSVRYARYSAEERFQRCDARAQQRDLGLLGACAVGAQ